MPRRSSKLFLALSIAGAVVAGPAAGQDPRVRGGARNSSPSTPMTGNATLPESIRDTWHTWWSLNADPYLHQPQAGASSSAKRGMVGRVLAGAADTGPVISDAFVRNGILPALMRALEEEDFLVTADVLVALGRSTPGSATAEVYEVIHPYLSHPELPIQQAALIGLGLLGDPRATSELIAIALDRPAGRKAMRRSSIPDPTRSRAALAAGLLEDPSVADELLAAVATETNLMLRSSFLWAAALAGPDLPSVAEALTERLQDARESRQIRAQAAICLGRLDSELRGQSLPTIVAALEDRRTPADLRISCVIALGRMATLEDEEALKLLQRFVRGGGDQRLRNQSFVALGRLLEKGRALPEALRREAAGDLLTRSIARPDNQKDQTFAALALGIGLRSDESALRDDAVKTLRRALKDENSPYFASALAVSLGLLRDVDSVPEFLRRLNDQQREEHATYFSQAIGLAGERSAAPLLRALVTDTDIPPRVRRGASASLALFGDREVVDQLAASIEATGNLEDVEAWTSALGALRCREAVNPLVGLLADSTRPGAPRAAAAAALGYLADRTRVSWYAPYAADKNYLMSPYPLELLRVTPSP